MNTTSVPLDLPHPTLDPRFDELIETYRAPLARLVAAYEPCARGARGRDPLSRRAVAPRDHAGAGNLGKQRGPAPHARAPTRTPHRRIDINADTDWTALTNAWLYPAETDASVDPLGIRRRVQAAGRRMAFGMASEYAVAALLAALAVWKLATNDGLDAFV